jgi:hypothetical protein
MQSYINQQLKNLSETWQRLEETYNLDPHQIRYRATYLDIQDAVDYLGIKLDELTNKLKRLEEIL